VGGENVLSKKTGGERRIFHRLGGRWGLERKKGIRGRTARFRGKLSPICLKTVGRGSKVPNSYLSNRRVDHHLVAKSECGGCQIQGGGKKKIKGQRGRLQGRMWKPREGIGKSGTGVRGRSSLKYFGKGPSDGGARSYSKTKGEGYPEGKLNGKRSIVEPQGGGKGGGKGTSKSCFPHLKI